MPQGETLIFEFGEPRRRAAPDLFVDNFKSATRFGMLVFAHRSWNSHDLGKRS